MEEDVKGLGDYLDILWRRKYWVLIPAILLSAVAIAVVMWLPSKYESTGTILIESQEIPQNLIQSTVTSYADQRIEIIKQKLMTTQKVMEVVNKYNLYREERQKSPSTAGIVSLFRSNTDIQLVKANVTDPVSGRAKRASIAFKVSFTDKSPRAAQAVASELVTQFLDENVKTRTVRAEETKAFLKEEADKLQKKVQDIEKQIAEFKDEYSNSLPELLQYNLSMIERLQGELASNQNEIMVMKDQVATMSLGLSNIAPYITEQQKRAKDTSTSGPEKLLQQLQTQYRAALAKYQASHPDVINLKKQIESLESELGYSGNEAERLQSQLDAAEVELSNLKQRYADNHPDVKAQVSMIENLKSQLAKVKSSKQSADTSQQTATNQTNNPAYLQLKLRIDSAEREINRLRTRQDEIKESLSDYQKRVSQTNQVSRAYVELTRDHDNTLSKYKELRAKQLQAELAQNLESENKGESFTLIEPPQVPSKPDKPNRPKLIVLGVGAAVGVGMALAILIELLFGGIRGYNHIAQITGKAPLVVIPMIVTANEDAKKKTKRMYGVLFIIVCLIAAIVAIHFYVVNLEVLWYKAMRKIGQL